MGLGAHCQEITVIRRRSGCRKPRSSAVPGRVLPALLCSAVSAASGLVGSRTRDLVEARRLIGSRGNHRASEKAHDGAKQA
jgi:hypothetical protein